MTKPLLHVPNCDKIAAVVADLDGVVTRTSQSHFGAWKKLFEEYLKIDCKLTVKKENMQNSHVMISANMSMDDQGMKAFKSS